MAKKHGKSSAFTITDIGGAERDLSQFCDSVEMPQVVATAETSGMGDSAQEFIPGMAGATISISGSWDNTATTGPDVVLGGLLGAGGVKTDGDAPTFEYGPEGSTNGLIRYTGTAILTGYTVSSAVGSKVTFTASLLVTGAVTRDVFA
jgi:hypothetical protein